MTHTRYDIVALGNAVVDVIAPVSEAFIEEWGIERDAMSLIDEDRAKALTGAAEGVEHSGGSAANTVAGIASHECWTSRQNCQPQLRNAGAEIGDEEVEGQKT